MFSAAFMFKPGKYDGEFHRLNDLISAAANATEGYLGAETWKSPDGEVLNAIYYWETLEALRVFSKHPTHLEAKKQYNRWYGGYHIVISQVLRSYGDNAIEHFTPNERSR